MNIRVYVAGPIGKEEGREARIHSAIEAAERLRRAGLFPFVPHLSVQWGDRYKHTYECWMAIDFEFLSICHALFRVPGESPGADREERFAIGSGIPVFKRFEDLFAWARIK